MRESEAFEAFVVDVEPGLRRALVGAVGVDRVDDALAEAFAYGFEHWDVVSTMASPVGYLFRVGQSRTRRRRPPRIFRTVSTVLPDVEPGLVDALSSLSESQRISVWLAHGCGWSHAEIAEVLEVSVSTVATHVSRGLGRLRSELGVCDDAQH